jgi:hypothetical protein
MFVSMKQKSRSIHVQFMSSEDGLQFVIRFAQMDLEALRAGDWLNLWEDFLAFLHLSESRGIGYETMTAVRFKDNAREVYSPTISHRFTGILGEGEADPRAVSDEDFAALLGDAQRDARTILDAFTRQPRPEDTVEGFVIPVVARCPWGMMVKDQGLLVNGSALQLFNEHVLYLLGLESPDRILRCPECDTIFYRIQKQAYCSRQCSNRATQRRWRERHEAPAPSPVSLPK